MEAKLRDFEPYFNRKYIALVVGYNLLTITLLSIYAFITGETNEQGFNWPFTSDDFVKIVSALVLAPFIEEFVFRKIPYSVAYQMGFSLKLTAIVSSLAWMSIHPFNSLGLFLNFVGGLFLFGLYHKYNSLLVNAFYHFLFNFTSIGIFVGFSYFNF